jgi:hypothetical protein
MDPRQVVFDNNLGQAKEQEKADNALGKVLSMLSLLLVGTVGDHNGGKKH